jgi:nucleotide-binding universal stress UspA family protein
VDLIVLGARGLGAVGSFLLGSVSLGITRHALCPVLVFREPARPVRTVTIAIDGSADARVAFDFFADLPLPSELRVRLVGVIASLGYPTSAPGFIGSTLQSMAQDFENEARRCLEAELRRLAATLRPRVRSVVTATPVGAPAATIVRVPETHGSDLIVVGARGLGTFERLALGSVSESVLRHATCPVLVVKPRA